MRIADAGKCAVFCASDKLKNKREFIPKCISGDKSALRDSSAQFKDDEQAVLAHFAKLRWSFVRVSPDLLRDNPEVAVAAIAQDPWSLQWCSERLQDNDKVVVAAVKSNTATVKFACERLFRELGSKAPEPTHELSPVCQYKRSPAPTTEKLKRRPGWLPFNQIWSSSQK